MPTLDTNSSCQLPRRRTLLALPLEGWALTSAHGITLALFGAVHLPNLIASDSELADVLSDYHVSLAWILLIVAGLHAAAALWHHFVRRDAVLAAMLPSLSLARGKSTVVDQRRNLAKKVTVE